MATSEKLIEAIGSVVLPRNGDNSDMYHALTAAFGEKLLNDVVNENEELKEQLNNYLSLNCFCSHANKF